MLNNVGTIRLDKVFLILQIYSIFKGLLTLQRHWGRYVLLTSSHKIQSRYERSNR